MAAFDSPLVVPFNCPLTHISIVFGQTVVGDEISGNTRLIAQVARPLAQIATLNRLSVGAENQPVIGDVRASHFEQDFGLWAF